MNVIYKAVDLNGHYVDGEMNVDSRDELAQRLQQEGLLLVSVHVTSQEQAAAAPTSSPKMEQPIYRAVDDIQPSTSFPQTTWMQRLLLLGLLGAGVLVGVWRYQHRPPINRAVVLDQKLSLLKEHMTRLEIEGILTSRYPNTPNPIKSLYYVEPYFVVEITYDSTGGSGVGQNRMIPGGLRVLTTSDIPQNTR